MTLEPVGVVVGGRTQDTDDDWGGVRAVIRRDEARFAPDAVASSVIRLPAWSTGLMRASY